MPSTIKDVGRRYVAANAAYAEMLGTTPSALLGRRDEELMAPRDAQEVIQRDQTVLAAGQAVTGSSDIHGMDREPIRANCVSRPIYEDGRVVGVVTCMDPLAAHREALESRERRLLSQVGQLAHDLRSPLAGMLGLAEQTLRDDDLTEAQRDHMAAMARCGEHLITTLQDLAEIGLTGRIRISLRPASVQLSQVLEDVVRRARPTMTLKEVALNSSLEWDGAPDRLSLMLDGQRLRQLLLSLVANAVHATRQGHIHLRCALLAPQEGLAHCGTRRLRFEVSDTGPHFMPQQLAKLAEDGATRELWHDLCEGRRGGAGLLTSRRLARALGGELQVRNLDTLGTAVWFDLPAQESPPPPRPQPQPQPA